MGVNKTVLVSSLILFSEVCFGVQPPLAKEMTCYENLLPVTDDDCETSQMTKYGFGDRVDGWKAGARVISVELPPKNKSELSQNLILVKSNNGKLYVYSKEGVYSYKLPSQLSSNKYPFILAKLGVNRSGNATTDVFIRIVDSSKILGPELAALAAYQNVQKIRRQWNPIGHFYEYIFGETENIKSTDSANIEVARINLENTREHLIPLDQVRFDLGEPDPALNDAGLKFSQVPPNVKPAVGNGGAELTPQTRDDLKKRVLSKISCVSKRQESDIKGVHGKVKGAEVHFDWAITALESCRGVFGQDADSVISTQLQQTEAISATKGRKSPARGDAPAAR